MTRNEILKKLANLISDIMGIDEAKIDDQSSPDTVSNWDSLTHVSLIAAIEENFGVVLTPEEQTEMLNVELILDILEHHLKI